MTTLAPEVTNTLSVANHPLSRELNATDRCDKCNAQAFVQIIVSFTDRMDAEILMCGHHYRFHAPAVAAKGHLVNDQTHRINEKGGASA